MTRTRTLLPLVAAVSLATLELVRSSGPLIDMAFAQGVTTAAATALGAYALPGLLALGLVATVRGPSAHRRLVTAAVTGAVVLAVVRAELPVLTAGVRFGVGLAAVALALAVLTLTAAASTGRHGPTATVRALVLGLVTHVGLQLALGTWDAVWRTDVAGWVVNVLTVAALAAGALVATVRRDAPGRAGGDAVAPAAGEGPGDASRPRLWALGPFTALTVMMLANPAFAASQSGVPLAVAGVLLAAALLLGGWLTGYVTRRRRAPGVTVALVVLGVGTTGGAVLRDGALALVALVLLALLAPPALAAALAGRPGGSAPSPVRTAGAAALVGLGTIVPLLVYQLDYDVPLGFPNGLVVVAAALALALATLGVAPRPEDVAITPSSPASPRATGRAAAAAVPAPPVRLLPALTVAAVATVVVGAALLATATAGAQRASATGADPRADAPAVTVVSWNLHYGVTPAGHVALEDVARAVERTGACVVLLQEVSRGWVLGGGADMATWLANRLDMRVSFAPAADHQFGNAILSCAPHDDVVVHELPYGDGPQRRSAISATVALGEPQRYTSVHLQHREENTPTRLEQLATLLAADDLGVLGGDLNAEPGWPEIDAVLAAGYTSAQDAVGDPDQLTSPSTEPRHRIDWVFTPDGLEPESLRHLTADRWSDHLALVLTHRVGG